MLQLYRFLTLPRGEQRLLMTALGFLVLIRLALGRVPFRVLRRMIVGAADRAAPAFDRRLAHEVVWAVTAVSRRLPSWTTCLTQAVAVQAMLARRGCPSRLHVGVIRDEGGALEGHAWVEHEGRLLIGGSAPEIARFVPLVAFEAEAGTPSVAQPLRDMR